MATFSNPVNPLFADIPIVNPNGTPTFDFMRKWAQQGSVNTTITDLTTAAGVSAVLDLIGKTVGDLLVRGTFTWGVLAPNTAGFVLTDGGAGAVSSWQQPHYVIAGGTTGQVLEKNSNTDYDLKWASPSGGGAPASIKDDGTNVYIGVQDSNGQLVLDGLGDPVWVHEVFSLNAVPPLTTANLTDVSIGTWAPVDASGGGLTFTGPSCGYTRIGNMVFAYAQIAYPSTADAHNSLISGLPFTAAAPKYANTVGIVENSTTETFHTLAQIARGTASIEFQDGFNNSILTNANLSGSTINFTIAYPIS